MAMLWYLPDCHASLSAYSVVQSSEASRRIAAQFKGRGINHKKKYILNKQNSTKGD